MTHDDREKYISRYCVESGGEGIEEVTSLRVPPLRGETLPALLT